MIAQFAPIVLAFGANLGDRAAAINAAFAELAAHPQISEFQASSLRQSVALTVAGRDEQAPSYLNAVATAVTTLSAGELLELVQQIENKHGRVRDTRWGDRTLDIDIIVYAGRVQRTPELTLPHPEAHRRDFVLSPWLQLDPGAALPRHGRVADLLAQLGDTTVPYDQEQAETAEVAGAVDPDPPATFKGAL